MLAKIKPFAARLYRDESGAALVEYSVLIGIVTVAVIAAIVLVGGWVSGAWTGLNEALTAAKK